VRRLKFAGKAMVATALVLFAGCAQKIILHPPPAPLVAPAPSSGTGTEDAVVQIIRLLEDLQAYARTRAPGSQAISFQLPEANGNAYLGYALKTRPRPGLDALALTIQPHNRVSALAVVNFEEVAGWAPRIAEFLLPSLHGRRPVRADFEFHAEDGVLTFKVLEARAPEGAPLDPHIVDMLIHYLAARQPEHYDISRPIPLPFGLRRVWTQEHLVAGET
jgi:hypothetical protein